MPAAAEKRKRLPADERREQLLDAARRVFVKTGFAAARIRMIADEAGVNDALLYQHFRSKEELFEAAVAEPLEESVERLLALGRYREGIEEGELREEHLRALLEELLSGMVASAPLIGIVLMAEPEIGERFYREHFAPAMQRLVAAIEAAQGRMRHRDFPADLVLQACVGTCLMLAIDQRYGGDQLEDRDEVVRRLTGVVRRALGQSAA
jgi:AcrR family transcriptional regulator